MPASPGISITCPWCRKRFRVHGGSAGRQFKCPTPNCGNTLVVPRPAQPETLDLDDAEPAPPTRPRAPSRDPFSLDDGETHAPGRTRSRSRDDETFASGRSHSRSDRPPRRRSKAPLLAAFALFVLLAGGGGAGYWFFLRDKTAASTNGDGAGGGGIVAVGPRVVLHGKLPDSIKIKRYYVAGEFRDFDELSPPEDWPQSLPSGTERVRVGMVFDFEPPNGTNIEVQVETPTGPFESKEGSFWIQIRGAGDFVLERELSRSNGGFADGQYKAKVLINGKPAADLNFAVGARLPTFPAANLKGTKWRQGTGVRFEFGADGSFATVHDDFGGPNGSGTRRTGRWEAKGTSFTAYVERSGDRGRVEYRGECVKDELRVRFRTEERDYAKKEIAFTELRDHWYPLGILRKDDGQPRNLNGPMPGEPEAKVPQP